MTDQQLHLLKSLKQTGEITSPEQGGTGRNFLERGSILRGNGVGRVTLSTPGQLRQEMGLGKEGPLPVNAGGTGATTLSGIKETLGIGKVLFAQEWSTGTVTVPETAAYTLFQITMSGQGTTILALRNGQYIRGIGGYSTATPTQILYSFAATVEGDVWTFVACNQINHEQTSSEVVLSEIKPMTVTKIQGII